MRVAYIVRSWPRLTQTFIVNEILSLEQTGVSIAIFAMAKADDPEVQPQVADVRAPVRYLAGESRWGVGRHVRVFAASPRRYARTLVFALRGRDLLGGYTESGALAAFDRATFIADDLHAQREQGRPFTHIHAHFAHDPTLVGLLAHRLTGLPFTFTAHARDLYQISGAALSGRVREASSVVTCCRANLEHIQQVVPGAKGRVELIYHGVDLKKFQPMPERLGHAPPLIVSVGRFVEKKGFDDLLGACGLLSRHGVTFRCEIYGEGPCREQLEALRDQLGLEELVTFCGTRTQRELIPIYQHADVFALTPRITDDGDRDGIPNVLVEAMACGIPVVATPIGGICELVTHGVDGLLAPANDISNIAACLERLLESSAARTRLGEAAARSASRFDSRVAAGRLTEVFASAGQRSDGALR